ncbi:MAG TPA: hypothetical protein VJN70_21095 [Gemmatimonadaceae bacterium]|nr:hypothetical protein [Gemmatimonadaceae bacterium]
MTANGDHPNFAKYIRAISLGCGIDGGEFNLQSDSEIADPSSAGRFAVGFGSIAHGTHAHWLLVQLERDSSDWTLHSCALTEVRSDRDDAVVVLDVRGSGVCAVGGWLAPPAHTLRVTFGDRQTEAAISNRVALLTSSPSLPTAARLHTEVLDRDGHRLADLSHSGLRDLGVSYQR